MSSSLCGSLRVFFPVAVALLSAAAGQQGYKTLSPQMHCAPITSFLQSPHLASADYFRLVTSLDYHIDE